MSGLFLIERLFKGKGCKNQSQIFGGIFLLNFNVSTYIAVLLHFTLGVEGGCFLQFYFFKKSIICTSSIGTYEIAYKKRIPDTRFLVLGRLNCRLSK